MKQYSLGNIRRDSIKRIFSLICEHKTITRHDIAEKTGLSLMTVGKITDILLLHKAVSYEKMSTGGVGRRAEYIKLADKLYMICAVIGKEQISVVAYDFTLKPCFEFELERKDKSEDALYDELAGEVMMRIIESGMVGLVIGIGVVHGTNEADFSEKIAAGLKGQLTLKISLCKDGMLATALGCAQKDKKEKMLYFSKTQGGYCGTYINSDTTPIKGSFAGSIEKVLGDMAAVCKFLGLDEMYVESENELSYRDIDMHSVDAQSALDNKAMGIMALLREEYLLN